MDSDYGIRVNQALANWIATLVSFCRWCLGWRSLWTVFDVCVMYVGGVGFDKWAIDKHAADQ